ncbi:FtsX-like permease family protein [Streptosporangium sp. NPDC051023]|uniref:ABC transporter permease n=1 Tax=Streptosporangium sp. NPDC051023 TaxID=3155410 RepID=UPI00344F065B
MPGRTVLVFRRSFSEPLLLFAAFGAILLATTTLVGLTMYATTVVDAGVRRTLETVPIEISGAVINAPVHTGSFDATDRALRAQVAETYAGVPVSVTVSGQSVSYAMPGQERRAKPELLRFGVQQGLAEQARLVRGAWPDAGGTGTGNATGETDGTGTGTGNATGGTDGTGTGTGNATGGTDGTGTGATSGSGGGAGEDGIVEAAITETVARDTGFSVGDVFTIEGRLDQAKVRVRIVGVFELREPRSGRWNGQALLARGVEIGDYVTHGPLMVSERTFLRRFVAGTSVTWLAVPDLRPLPSERLRPFAAEVGSLQKVLRARPGCEGCSLSTRLPERLTQLATATLVARSTMLVPVLQLLLLAAYSLTLTARLLADHRRMETALLRSRGAGAVRLALLAAGEALLVALPCAVVAPLLALPLLGAVNALPWTGTSGTPIEVGAGPAVYPAAYAVSAAVALGCAVLMTLPALGGARRTYVAEQGTRGRGERYGLLQRAGADVVLLAVAALAVWQMQRYGAPVTTTAGGELGIDPLIVAGPAVALLCGGLIGLRFVPPVSRIAERLTSRRADLAPALGAWQVSRRPARYSGPALLLTMAIAIGVVSMATTATWRDSQEDQARHQAGTDLRVASPPDNAELGPLGRAAAYAALPGVTSLSPAYQVGSELAGEETNLLAVDGSELPGMLKLRPDLSGDPVGVLARRLTAARPRLPGLPIPGRPERLLVRTRLAADDPALAEPYGSASLTLVIADGENVRHPVRFTPGLGERETAIDLAALHGRGGRLTYPLTVAEIVADVPLPPVGTGFETAVLRIETGEGAQVGPAAGMRLAHGITAELAMEQSYETGHGLFAAAFGVPPRREIYDTLAPQRITVVPVPRDVPDKALFPGEGAPQGTYLGPLPVILTADLAARQHLVTGSTAKVTLDRRNTVIKVAGIVDELPGTPSDKPAVLLDWQTMQAWDLFGHRTPRLPTEWWLGTGGAETAAAAEQLGRHPAWDVTVVDLSSLAGGLRDDPLANGLRGALVLGFLAALAFALLGFVVNAAVAARERMAEFAILRALGVGFRQVFGLLAVEQAFLICLSLTAGTTVAVVVASLVVPHIVLTGQAAAVTPRVLLDIPWTATLALLAAVAVLLFVIVAVLARVLRRQGMGRALRIGEDR